MIDIRINRGGGNGKVPFGFVVFDNEEPVKQLLQLKVRYPLLIIYMVLSFIATLSGILYGAIDVSIS